MRVLILKQTESIIVDFLKKKHRDLGEVIKGGRKNINEEESEYEVESILDHKANGSKLYYLVKWKGYSEDDLSWVYEEDLFAEDLIKQYWEKTPKTNNKNSRSNNNLNNRSSRNNNNNDNSSNSTRINTRMSARTNPGTNPGTNVRTTITPAKRTIFERESINKGLPKKAKTIKVTLDNEYEILIMDDNWENKVESVETIVRDDKTKELFVYLRWKNGKVSRHPSKEANAKCPQKIIDFYEKRLLFASPSSSLSKPKNRAD